MPAPSTVQITGSLWHPATGTKITAGQLRIKPKSIILSSSELVVPVVTLVTVPVSGDLNFSLVPSNGVPYTVEFDPTPSDTATPLKQKSGYFINTWTVPASGPVNIAAL